MANILVFGNSCLGFNDFKAGGWVDRLRGAVNEINKKDNSHTTKLALQACAWRIENSLYTLLAFKIFIGL